MGGGLRFASRNGGVDVALMPSFKASSSGVTPFPLLAITYRYLPH
jgi:hypothetical protein